MKRFFCILMTVCLLILPGTAVSAASGEGTTPTNRRAGSIAVSDGDNTYYAAFDGIYKTSLTSGTSQKLVSPASLGLTAHNGNDISYDGFSRLDISGGFLYFHFGAEWGFDEYDGIYRCNLQSGAVQKLYSGEEEILYLEAKNGKVIFCKAADNGEWLQAFYEMNDDGSGLHPLGARFPGSESSFLVSDGWVYYIDLNDPQSLKPLYKMKLDGTGKTNLNSGYVYYASGSLCIQDGWLYYWQESVETSGGNTFIAGNNDINGVYKMRTDGSGRTRVMSSAANHLYGEFNPADGRFYCVEAIPYPEYTRYTLVSRDMNGGDRKVLADFDQMVWLSSVTTTPGWLYFECAGLKADAKIQNGSVYDQVCSLYRVRTDGTGLEKLASRTYESSPNATTVTIEVPLG